MTIHEYTNPTRARPTRLTIPSAVHFWDARFLQKSRFVLQQHQCQDNSPYTPIWKTQRKDPSVTLRGLPARHISQPSPSSLPPPSFQAYGTPNMVPFESPRPSCNGGVKIFPSNSSTVVPGPHFPAATFSSKRPRACGDQTARSGSATTAAAAEERLRLPSARMQVTGGT